MKTEKILLHSLWATDGYSPAQKTGSFLLASFLGSLVIALFAQISIPFYPVPLSGQTFAVLCVGFFMGWKRAGVAVLMYIAEGMGGLPFFAGGSFGPAVMIGPSGGYIVGFLPAAVLCGYFSQKLASHNVFKAALVFFAASAVIYCFGLLQLGSIIGWSKQVPALGLYPFLIGDALKIVLATALFSLLRKKL